MSDIAKAIIAVGAMGFVAFLCWLTHGLDPLWMLVVLVWLFLD